MHAFKGCIRHALAGLLLAMFTMSFAGGAFAYCASKGNSVSYEWANHIAVGGFSNTSGANGGYADFTSQVINLVAGTNSVVLTPGFRSSSYTEYWKIWIDFNGDDIFAESEAVFNGASSSAISGSLVVPETAANGTTTMRVSMRYGGAPSSCGNFSYGEVEDYTVYLDTTDTTSPTVISKVPDSVAVDVAPNSVINVTFSEEIDPLSISNSSIALSTGGMYLTGVVNLSGSVATFTPDQPLEYSTNYTVTVYSGLLDLAGNPLLQDEVWSFTTVVPDMTAPTITQPSPQDGAVDVANSYVVQAFFSEPMDPATINASTFTISDGINNITGSIVLNGNGYTAQFYSDQPFEYLTTYTATISTGAKDLAGNAMQSDYSWSFTSREYQLEYCTSAANNYSFMWISAVKVGSFTHSSPSQPYTGYSNNISTIFDLSWSFTNPIRLTPGYSGSAYTTYWRVFIDWDRDGVFSSEETVFSGSGNGIVNGSIVIPEYALPGNTRMRVSLQYATYPGACGILSYGEVEDFRVYIPEQAVDTTPPDVLTVSPLENALNVGTDSTVMVEFSEAIDQTTLYDNSLTLTGGISPVTVSVSYNMLTNQAVFTPSANLDYNTVYAATLASGIQDLSGNAMLNNHSWSFTTEQEPGPVYAVSGTVQHQGVGLADVMINVSGDAPFITATDSTGAYSLASVPPGTYTIAPSKAGYAFTPQSIGVNVIDADVTALDFTADILMGALVNSDFETGDFTGYNVYTMSGGQMTSDVVMFDTNNDGVSSYAGKFNVGTSYIGNQFGGGIYQTVNLTNGELTVTVDIAATANANNAAGGFVQIFLDGVLMNSHDFGSITAGINEYATLSFNTTGVTAGTHEIRIQMTRTYAPTSVANYVDEIVLTGSSTQ